MSTSLTFSEKDSSFSLIIFELLSVSSPRPFFNRNQNFFISPFRKLKYKKCPYKFRSCLLERIGLLELFGLLSKLLYTLLELFILLESFLLDKLLEKARLSALILTADICCGACRSAKKSSRGRSSS